MENINTKNSNCLVFSNESHADFAKGISEELIPENSENIRINNVIPSWNAPWWRVGHLVKLSWAIFVLTLASTNYGYDGSLLNGLYEMPDFMDALGNPTSAILGAISNGIVFGVFLSLYFIPRVIDKWGRKMGVIIGNVLILIGVLLQSCSVAWISGEIKNSRGIYAMFLLSRIVLGAGVSFLSVSAPALISEISYPAHRQVCNSLYNTCWYVGALVAAWVTYGTRNMAHHWNWRAPSILQGLFPAIQLFLKFWVPESPRYYVYQNKKKEAREVLLRWHASGDESKGGQMVDFELTEIKLAIKQEKMAFTTSYKDFFQTTGNRRRLWIVCWTGVFMQFSGNGLVSYYLSKIFDSIGTTSADEKLRWNGWLMLYNWLGSTLIIFLIIPRLKRRQSFLISLCSMCVVYIIWTALSAENQKRNFKDKPFANGVLAMIFMYYWSYDIGLNGFPFLYVAEILPYTLRGKGLNIFQAAQNLVLIFNGFVNPVAMDAIEWKYYIMFCCILGVEILICYFTFVETSCRSLEEVGEVFGDGIVDIPHLANQFLMEDGKGRVSAEHAEYVS